MDDLTGKVLGRCRLVRKVGEGGMGAVYLAHHETLNKDVAVKMLSGPLASNPDFVGRFLREAQSAARLDHPNVVQVLDAASDDGLHFIVMQFVDGTDLSELLKRKGKFAVKDALSIAKKVAQALSAAHKLGMVHRDIKPANILLTKQGRVMVSDFGLAKEVGAGNTVTATDQIVGTPQFLPPEQAKGEKVDARSDLYSLGATLYCLLTGKPPYTGASAMAIVLKHVSETERPEPLRKIDPAIPEDVAALVEKMMEKVPGKRFQTADEFVAAIDRIKGEASMVASPGGATVQVLTPQRKRKLILYGAGAGVIGLVLLVVLLKGFSPGPAERAFRAAQSALTEEEEVARYREVVEKFPGSEWSVKAEREIREIEERRRQAEFAAVESEFGRIAALPDPFEALKRFEEFQKIHAGTEWARKAGEEIAALRRRAQEGERKAVEELERGGKASFPEVVRRVEEAGRRCPWAADQFEAQRLGLHRARVVERTESFGRYLKGKKVDQLDEFRPPSLPKEEKLGARFLQHFFGAGLLHQLEIQKFEIDRKGVRMKGDEAVVPVHFKVTNRKERSVVESDVDFQWGYEAGDWYVKPRPKPGKQD